MKNAVIGGAAAATLPAAGFAVANTGEEFYELRVYTLKDAAQQKLVEDYFKTAAIPALNKLGVKHVGVFSELKPVAQTRLYVFMAYNSLEHYTTVMQKLDNDPDHLQRGADYLNAPATSPAYERIESSLLKAFAHMPAMAAPPATPRIFELRQYQSASEGAGKKKIEMFNDEGEIDIFKRLGFRPVFWGETIIGALRPNLTYMVTFDDMAAHDARWKSFVADAQWKKISSVPEYADALLVNKITSTLIIPAAFSQI